MKIYVDKIPESCRVCKLSTSQYYPGYNMTLHHCSADNCLRNLDEPDLIQDPCPLESLAAHDAEVTKQVCKDLTNYILNKTEGGNKHV